jgi:octaprenyl-diphosphate synthase
MELQEIYRPISNELYLVEEELGEQVKLIIMNQNLSCKKYMKQIIRHIFNVPGKLLRPALVLLSAKAVNDLERGNTQEVIKLAAAVEFIHSASLIHDDIIDESVYRRHQLTLNKQFDNQIAVMVGDILYSQFFSILIGLRTENPKQRDRILNIFCETTKKMCFGEIEEHKIRKSGENPTLHEYLNVMENKTACLFATSCQTGSLINGADEEVSQALANYGLYLGLLFQIVDDFIDNDSIFSSDVSMIEKAEEYAMRAKSEIHLLKESGVKKTLLGIIDYVEQRVEEDKVIVQKL